MAWFSRFQSCISGTSNFEKRKSRPSHHRQLLERQIMKLKFAVFGNCQVHAVAEILADHAPFTDRFEIVPTTPVYLLTDDTRQSAVDQAVNFDILLYNQVSDKYAPATSQAVLDSLPSGAKAIKMVSMWFGGYTPDVFYAHGSPAGEPSVYHHSIIAGGVLRGWTADRIITAFSTPGWIDAAYIQQAWNDSLEKLFSREADCDLKMVRFLQANATKRRLFHTLNHPQARLFYIAAQQVLARLEVAPLGDEVKAKHLRILSNIRSPISESVRVALGLEFPSPAPRIGVSDISLRQFVEMFCQYYKRYPEVIEAHRERLEEFPLG